MTKSKRLGLAFGAWIAFVVCAALGGGIGVAAEFSADLSVQTKGEEPMVGKVFVKNGKIRQEVGEGGEHQVMIIRPDKQVSWMISPEDKTYTEIAYQANDKAMEEWSPEVEKGAKFLSDEAVGEHPCKKFEVIEEGEKTYYWVSKKLNFPIKFEDSETTFEYKNLKEGSVADSLFDIPEGFEKMVMPEMPPDKPGAPPVPE